MFLDRLRSSGSAPRRWLSETTAARPSWRWSLVVAAALAVCFAAAQRLVAASDSAAGLQPDASTWTDPGVRYGDFALFVRAGHALLAGDLAHVYDNAAVQTGPLALMWAGALAFVMHAVHASADVGYGISAVAMLAPAVYAASIWAARHRPPRWLYAAAACGLVVLAVPWQLADLLSWQHPTYLWVPSLWLLAGSAARENRPTLTAIMIAIACGLETWAVLAVPVVLLALPTWRSRAQAGVMSALCAAAVWAPFVASGHFAMFSVTWPNVIRTPISALVGDPDVITWQIRAVQALVIVGAGLLAWLATRGDTDPVAVSVCVVAWARVVTEAQWYPYYRLPIFATTIAIVLAAAAHRLGDGGRRSLPALGVGGAMTSVAQAEALVAPLAARTTIHVVALSALVAAARRIPYASASDGGTVGGPGPKAELDGDVKDTAARA